MSAWLAPVVHRRKETERQLIAVEPLHWPYIAPTMAPLLAIPQAKVIRFVRKIKLPPPLDVYPPPTGPPELYPAWAARTLGPVSQRRKLIPPADQVFYPATPVPAEYPAFVPTGFLRRRETDYRLLEPPPHAVYPVAEAPVSPSILEPAFLTRRIRSRRHVTALPPIVADVAPPIVTTFLPAVETIRREETRRYLIVALIPPEYPPPPAPPAVEFAALRIQRVKPRKHRQGLFLGGSAGIADARISAQYPSYAKPSMAKRKATKRKLRRVLGLPATPATPATQATYPAYRTTGFHDRRQTERRLIRELTAPVYPAPATPPPVEFAATLPSRVKRRKAREGLFFGDGGDVIGEFTPPEVSTDAVYNAAPPFKVREVRGKRLVNGLIAPVFPASPPTAQGYPARLVVGFHRRSETRRTLQVLPSAPLYAPTPASSQGYPGWLAKHAYRSESERRLLIPAHNPAYPQTPVPPQPFTATIPPRVKRSRFERTVQIVDVSGLYSVPASPPGETIYEIVPYLIGSTEAAATAMIATIYCYVIVIGTEGTVTAQSLAPFSLTQRFVTITITLGGPINAPRGGKGLPDYNSGVN